MHKYFSVIALLVCLSFSTSKSTFNEQNVETLQLESLLVEQINAVRKESNLNPLKQNAILKKAAEDQAKYISSIGKLSHKQPAKNKAKTRNRVEFYGGKMQGIGENTAFIKVFRTALFKGKGGQIDTVNINTKEQAAEYFVHAWMNSAPHKVNILYPDYKETGLKVVYNKSEKALYAVQVFAYPYK